MYVIMIEYLVDFEKVQDYLADHRQYLKSHYAKGNLVCSGPKLPKTGGIVISKFMNMDDVLEFVKNDPFTLNNIAKHEIIEFDPVLMAGELRGFLEKGEL